MFEVREVLRLWVQGVGLRAVERLAGMDRKTVRRYINAAIEEGVSQQGGEEQLSDAVIGLVVERIRPHRRDGRGDTWRMLDAHQKQIKAWIDEDHLTVVKVRDLLSRQGVVVPQRTLTRYAAELCGPRRGRSVTVRVVDGEPGDELQVDFGRMGKLFDTDTGRVRICQALIFTACYSRHCFVWLSFAQTTAAVIEGCEAAWEFFGGVFHTVIPDNLGAIVDKANHLEPRLNQAFVEYAQARGFAIDPARVRRPQDKPRVERTVTYVRGSMFAGETFIDLSDAQRRARLWCETTAGLRIHGTLQCRPADLFALEEAPRLLPAPESPYDLPLYAKPKVHRDHHCEVGKALYSVPGNLIGHHLDARADRQLVKLFFRGQLVKVHPRKPPGGRSTDPGDLPEHKSVYAMRDLARLQRMAANHGDSIGVYAAALLDNPLPWTKMRQVYALLGLVEKWGSPRVGLACARALEVEAVNVGLIGRMLERGTENQPAPLPVQGTLLPGRFARQPAEFATTASKAPHPGAIPGANSAPETSMEDGFGSGPAVEAEGAAR